MKGHVFSSEGIKDCRARPRLLSIKNSGINPALTSAIDFAGSLLKEPHREW